MTDPGSSRPKRYRLPAAGALFFIVLTAFVLSLGFWCEWRAHRQREVLDHVRRLGGYCSRHPASPESLHDVVQTALGEEHAAGYTVLTAVKLDRSSVADEDLRLLARQWELESLSLADTRITGNGLRHLRGLHLTGLNLDGTRVSDAGLRYVGELHALQSLFLENTAVGDAGLAHLAGLEDLEVLHLGGTRITDDGLRHLGGLVKLRWIQLNDTGVTDSGLKHLIELPALSFADLRNTEVTTPGVDQLRWGRPGIGIDR